LTSPTGWTATRYLPGLEFVSLSMRGMLGHISGSVMRCSALPDPTFDDRDSWADDEGLWIRIGLVSDVVYTPEPAALVARSEESISATIDSTLAADMVRRGVKLRAIDGPAGAYSLAPVWREEVESWYRQRVMWNAGAALRTSRSVRSAKAVLTRGQSVGVRVLTDPRAWRTGIAGAGGPRLASAVSNARARLRAR
jgi:hypothetical protein